MWPSSSTCGTENALVNTKTPSTTVDIMPLINQPSNQIKYAPATLYESPILSPTSRLTNVSIVRLKKGGRRFEASQSPHTVFNKYSYVLSRLLAIKTRSRNGEMACKLALITYVVN